MLGISLWSNAYAIKSNIILIDFLNGVWRDLQSIKKKEKETAQSEVGPVDTEEDLKDASCLRTLHPPS